MSYAQLDEHFDEHPKFAALELEHFGLMACAIAYCNRLLTDGFVPTRAVRGFGASGKGVKLAARLVEAGIWLEVDGGYGVRGFLDHNPSRVTVLARRESVRARKERSRDAAVTPSVTADVTRDKTRDGRVTSRGSHVATSLHCTTNQETDPPLPSVAAPVGANTSAGGPRQRRKPETAAPRLSEPVAAWAETWSLPTEHPEFSRFLSHHQAKESLFRDWAAAWRTWLGNAEKYAANGGRGGRIVQRDPPGIVREIGWFDPEDAVHAQTGS